MGCGKVLDVRRWSSGTDENRTGLIGLPEGSRTAPFCGSRNPLYASGSGGHRPVTNTSPCGGTQWNSSATELRTAAGIFYRHMFFDIQMCQRVLAWPLYF